VAAAAMREGKRFIKCVIFKMPEAATLFVAAEAPFRFHNELKLLGFS
jgi:hypothetical protein